jgi:hypothetical protein
MQKLAIETERVRIQTPAERNRTSHNRLKYWLHIGR